MGTQTATWSVLISAGDKTAKVLPEYRNLRNPLRKLLHVLRRGKSILLLAEQQPAEHPKPHRYNSCDANDHKCEPEGIKISSQR